MKFQTLWRSILITLLYNHTIHDPNRYQKTYLLKTYKTYEVHKEQLDTHNTDKEEMEMYNIHKNTQEEIEGLGSVISTVPPYNYGQ